jgi:hypothetical protein
MINYFKQKDKQIHFAAGFVTATITAFFTNNIYLAVGAATFLGLFKDVVWDLWLKRGTFDYVDIIATILGSVPIIFYTCFIK